MKAQECTATKCNECGEIKSPSEFYESRKTRKCKQCEGKASHLRYLRSREKVLERSARRRAEKAPEIKKYLAKWYVANKDHVLDRCREYNRRPEVKQRESKRQSARWLAVRDELLARRKAIRDSDPNLLAEIRAYSKVHYRNNKLTYYARTGKRRAVRVRAVPKWADLKAIKKVYRLAVDMSVLTGIKHHVDHIVPLQGRTVCGLHVEHNLQVIPAKANLEKAFKLVEDIVRSRE